MSVQNGEKFDCDMTDLINVEICQKNTSVLSENDLIHAVKIFFKQASNGPLRSHAIHSDHFLTKHVERLSLWDSQENPISANAEISLKKEQLLFHAFHLRSDQQEDEMLDVDNEELPAATHWVLPSKAFHNLWETLVYDSDIKENLVRYASTAMLFADKGVDHNIITWNRVVLLHGPPGTGKTSLCHALAQKLSIRLSHRFSCTSLLEINSHSLFSKWFSESGKLVMKMFKKVEELVEDENHLICLLIDEVESLTAARASVQSGTEPSDAIRVVNALLTEIDKLKRYNNVLILTTSNVTGKIDLAFIDRADIKFFVGFPSPTAIYAILRSCLEELCRTKVIHSAERLFTSASLAANPDLPADKLQEPGEWRHSRHLWKISTKCEGLSGRTLRKLPFLAHARFVRSNGEVSLEEFLEGLSRIVEVQFKERERLSNI